MNLSTHTTGLGLWGLLMFDVWRERYLPGARWS